MGGGKLKNKKSFCSKSRSYQKTKLHEVTSNKFSSIIDIEARHQKEMASMLMTTGTVQDHVHKEDLGFTEQPAFVGPTLNRGIGLGNASLLSYSMTL